MGLIEETGRRHGVEHPIQMTVATTDGKSVWAFRYSSEHDSRSLFHSTDVATLREAHPDLEVLQRVSRHPLLSRSRSVISPGLETVPESSYAVVQAGDDELHPFTPQVPSRSTAVAL